MTQTPVTGTDVVSTQQTKLDVNSKLQMDRTLELVKVMNKKKEKEKKSSGEMAKKEKEKRSSGEKEKKSSGETAKSAEAVSKAEPTSKMPVSSETQMDQASKMPSKLDQASKMQSKMTPATKSKMKAVSKLERFQDRQKKVGKSMEKSIERSVDRKPKKSGGMKSMEKSLERSVDRKGKKNSGMKRRKAMNSQDSNDPTVAPTFSPGMVIQTKELDWKVRSMLGSGGFGSVYLVEARDIKAALKVEAIGSRRMKQELLLYLEMYKKRKQKRSEPPSNPPEDDKKDAEKEDELLDLSHFPELYDRAQSANWQCIVMERLGLSLHDFRDTVLKKDYSIPTTMNIAKQALDAIRNLHRMGWVHRDLKPHNFVIGFRKAQPLLYLIDFGISRNIAQPLKNMYEPKKDFSKEPSTMPLGLRTFRGSRVFDCFDKKRGLPWKGMEDMSEVKEMKLKFMSCEWGSWFTSPPVTGPLEMKEVVEYVTQLPTSYINYDKLVGLVQEAGEKMGVTFNEKADWIEEAPEEKRERKRPKKKRVEEVELGEQSEDEKSQEEKRGSKAGSKAGSRAKSKQKRRLTRAKGKAGDREQKAKKSKVKRSKKAEEKPKEKKSPESPKKEAKKEESDGKKEETQRLEAEHGK